MSEKLEIIITADSRQAINAINKVGRASERQGKSVRKSSKVASAGFFAIGGGAKLAAAAVAATALIIGKKAVTAASGFGRAMAEVSTITTDTAAQNVQLTERVKEMSVAMGVDAQETARGLYQTISAGVTDSEDALKLLNVATKASIAGLTSQEVAVDAITTVMNAYGLSVDDAEDITDTLFKTVQLGKTRFESLASSLGKVIPIAALSGVSFEEVGGALAVLTKGGLSTEEASTALRAALTAVIQPTTQMKDAAKKAGIAIGFQALKSKGLTGILEALVKIQRLDAEATLKLFQNKRALIGILGLVKDESKEFTTIMVGMADKLGVTEEAFRKMNEAAFRQFAFFEAKLNVVMINLGNKIIPGLVTALKGFELGLGTLDKGLAGNKEAFEGVGIAIGTVIGALGSLISKYGETVKAIEEFAGKNAKALNEIEVGGITLGTFVTQPIGDIAKQLQNVRRAEERGIIAGGTGDIFSGRNIDELGRSTRNTRSFDGDPLLGKRVLEAARQSPTVINTGPIHVDQSSTDKILSSDFWRDRVQGTRMA